ncbi:hypothetical protein jhhlp_000932 [Lomentospora prolificans]|uniref:Lysophospholipase n=1 Tax=Lomentospora prolificans TaxID=41688 RepID=A0A2N3NJX8_9PEZI|nr:hypothetical protein jhhlp_000932 [Lomentospora prolificans]
MWFSRLLALGLVSAGASARASPDGQLHTPRAAPDSPSGGYAPAVVDCPSSRPSVRSGSALSNEERKWLETRDPKTKAALDKFFGKVNIADFDYASYLQKDGAYPRVAIAVSGGGYRALLNGAGFIAAADERTGGDGGIAGLLQTSTYLAGLSGGGWLVGSIFGNNFTTIDSLRNDKNVWQFQESIISGPPSTGLIGVLDTARYWSDLYDQVSSKGDAGFETSLTDFWGRAVSYQLLRGDDGGAAYTFSSISDSDDFKNGDTPFPILVADGRAPNTKIVNLNSTVFEFNPYEMGSWDPTLSGFIPLKYLGSEFEGGKVNDSGNCVRGFDQLGFVMGTSSSLFNMALLTEFPNDVPKTIVNTIQSLFKRLDKDNNDIAQYAPNPFKGYNTQLGSIGRSDELSLVDGGEDLQNIPLHPLIQPHREVDVIFAVDSSADTTYSWPNGTALRASYDRSKETIANGTQFPAVPDDNSFINLKLNQQPTFFGCSVSDFESGSTPPPLVVYIPNAPLSAFSNVSTFTPSYELEQRNEILRNGFDVATRGNGTFDDKWPTCVACAALSRSFDRTGTTPPQACQDCFSRYCWNGDVDTTSVSSYEPGLLLNVDSDSLGAKAGVSAALWLVSGVATFVMIFG